jgi:hypothetical protein
MLWLLIMLAPIVASVNSFRASSSITPGVNSSRWLPRRLAMILCGLAEYESI